MTLKNIRRVISDKSREFILMNQEFVFTNAKVQKIHQQRFRFISQEFILYIQDIILSRPKYILTSVLKPHCRDPNLRPGGGKTIFWLSWLGDESWSNKKMCLLTLLLEGYMVVDWEGDLKN